LETLIARGPLEYQEITRSNSPANLNRFIARVLIPELEQAGVATSFANRLRQGYGGQEGYGG
jgi:hypothetical protein